MRLTQTIHFYRCDGCGQTTARGIDLPAGLHFQVTEITLLDDDVTTGELYVCQEACLLRAFQSRHELWRKNGHKNEDHYQ